MDKDVLKLAETIGNFIQYWGFKEIHGKVWTLVYLSQDPISAKELKESLDISKALLSSTIKELKEHKLIDDAGFGAHGTQLFQAQENILIAITNVLKHREKKFITEAKVASKAIKPNAKVDHKRLMKLKTMINLSSKTLNTLIKWEHLSLAEWKIFGRR